MEIIDIKDSIVSEQIKTSIDEMVNAYCDELIKQDKEIIRLNNIIKNYEINTIPTLEHNIDVLVDSEDRLNNIINELEKYLEKEYLAYNEEDIQYYYGKDILDKLNELKGSDKDDC